MVVLGPAIAFYGDYALERGFRPWEKSLLAALWLTPLFARAVAQASLLPIGLISMIALLAFILTRGLRDAGTTALQTR